MEYKLVTISDTAKVCVPLGLTPDEEAIFIANRIAFVDVEKLENDCVELFEQWEAGKLISLESVLNEVEKEMSANGSLS